MRETPRSSFACEGLPAWNNPDDVCPSSVIMVRPLLFVLVALLLGVPATVVLAQPVPAPVARAIPATIAPHEFSIVVQPLDGGAPLVSHNADIAFNPASTMKLVTTYAALSLLGPDYRWSTGFATRGRLLGDVLQGDLVLRGGGDPKLVIEDMTELVARLRGNGLREIVGNLVIDESLYDLTDSEPSIDGDTSQPYNVMPHAALMNFKATKFVFRPSKGTVAITLDPPLAGVRIVNEVKLVRGACRFGASGLVIRDAGTEARPEIRVGGAYAAGCGEQSTMVAVLNHRQYIDAFFRSAWQAAGGTWNGRAVLEQRPSTRQLTPLADWVSPRTLGEVVKDINKFSNNVMARQVMLQTSVQHAPGQPATLERARSVIGTWLDGRGLKFRELVIDNGSGLSRQERISASSLARLLVDVGLSDHRAIFVDSLPVVGVDGTMKHRLTTDPIAGNAWIKTGSLDGVRSIAGYVNGASGRRYAVVMLINGARADGSRPAQDALLRWVHADN
jgi:serine-type D-Ala-D-Ala carboxypeptidase/endopeptidase (penicillin-binding protein 4)